MLCLLPQDAHRVFVGVAAVDDEGKLRFAAGGDMDAETLLLLFPRAVLVVIIKPCLADANQLRVCGAALTVVVVLALVIAFGVTACEPTPAEPTGIELDIDRAKTRPPLKTAKPAPAPKTKAGKR